MVPAVEAPWAPMLRRLRRESFGLDGPLIGTAEHVRVHGALNAWSPHVLPAPTGWPTDAVPAGFWRLPAPDWRPPRRLLDFFAAREPPVYVGFGSTIDKHPAALGDAVVRGLRRARRRAAAATGSGAPPLAGSADSPAPDPAPSQSLLPRVAAAVHHGGIGTVAAASTAGTPQVIKPFLGDQRFWPRRAHAIGVATSLRTLTPDAIADAITTAISTLTPRARALSTAIQREHGIETAITRLEHLVQRR